METLPVVLATFLALSMVPVGKLTSSCLNLLNNCRFHVFTVNRRQHFDSKWSNTRSPRDKIHTRSMQKVCQNQQIKRAKYIFTQLALRRICSTDDFILEQPETYTRFSRVGTIGMFSFFALILFFASYRHFKIHFCDRRLQSGFIVVVSRASFHIISIRDGFDFGYHVESIVLKYLVWNHSTKDCCRMKMHKNT